MANSPVFDRSCHELERLTGIESLAARGTVRIALRTAGLSVASVDVEQMGVVLRRILPDELAARGVADARDVCEAIAERIESLHFDVGPDHTASVAKTVARLGS